MDDGLIRPSKLVSIVQWVGKEMCCSRQIKHNTRLVTNHESCYIVHARLREHKQWHQIQNLWAGFMWYTCGTTMGSADCTHWLSSMAQPGFELANCHTRSGCSTYSVLPVRLLHTYLLTTHLCAMFISVSVICPLQNLCVPITKHTTLIGLVNQ